MNTVIFENAGLKQRRFGKGSAYSHAVLDHYLFGFSR
jgi:hypothetical protein